MQTLRWMIVLIAMRMAFLAAASASGVFGGLQPQLRDDYTNVDADAAGAAAAVQPALIGADGYAFTQVQLAQQKLGLSGRGVRVGVVDTGVDYLHTTNFGSCTGLGQPAGSCRVVAGANAEDPSKPPVPEGPPYASHGTHCAGIIGGAFPQKMRDSSGTELAYQRGVAYGCLLGAYLGFDTSNLRTAAVNDSMEIVNYSAGLDIPNPESPSEYLADLANDVIMVAAAGNEGDSGLHSLTYPSAYASKVSVANIRNTATPGAEITLSRAISVAGSPTRVIRAWLRADTPSSADSRTLGGRLPAPLLPVSCQASGNATALALLAAALTQQRTVAVFDCNPYRKSQAIADLARKAAAVFVAVEKSQELPSSPSSPGDVPAFQLTNADGAALLQVLAAAAAAGGAGKESPLRAVQVVAWLSPLLGGMQPDWTTSWGPGMSLEMKPDLAAPGSLYSSIALGNYANYLGTSMATPYTAGAMALWKEQRKQLWGARPPGCSWTTAAKRDFKLTARPVELAPGLAWPVARVGAGLLQVYNAVVNRVSIEPYELPLPSVVLDHTLSLTLSNNFSCDVSYRLGHLPAASISLAGRWNKVNDYTSFVSSSTDTTATATFASSTITVPKRGTAKVVVRLQLAGELAAAPFLYSGYITLQPLTTACPFHGSTVHVPLAVAYQGSSKAYSSALQVPVLAPSDSLTPELRDQNNRLCVLDSSYWGNYYNLGGNTVDKPTCLPQDGSFPAVVDVTRQQLARSRLCAAIAAVRPVASTMIHIEKLVAAAAGAAGGGDASSAGPTPSAQADVEAAWVPFGRWSNGISIGINSGKAVPCFVWKGQYEPAAAAAGEADGGKRGDQLVMPEDAYAFYRITVEMVPPIPLADGGVVAESVSVTLQQLLRVVPEPDDDMA